MGLIVFTATIIMTAHGKVVPHGRSTSRPRQQECRRPSPQRLGEHKGKNTSRSRHTRAAGLPTQTRRSGTSRSRHERCRPSHI